jgi:DNA-binding CsgD family transcriptional regulator
LGVAGEARAIERALAMARRLPDVVLIDFDPARPSALAAIRRIATSARLEAALEVLDLLARRWDNRRIATGAHMSRATVSGDISGILPKLNVENRVRVAVRAGKESLLDQQESP